MTRYEIGRPCHVAAPAAGQAAHYAPWLEAALLVRIEIAAWQLRDEDWAYWAALLDASGKPTGEPRRFDRGRYAMAPGEPEGLMPLATDPIGESVAHSFVDAVLARWHPRVHRQAALDLVSRLDEPREEFRRRCLTLLRPLLGRDGAAGENLAERLGRIASGVETVDLGREEIAVRYARVGVVWYPAGREPAQSAAALMTGGAVRGER